MSTVERAKRTTLPPLEAGQRLDQPTFHERYEAMPPKAPGPSWSEEWCICRHRCEMTTAKPSDDVGRLAVASTSDRHQECAVAKIARRSILDELGETAAGFHAS